MNQQSNFSFLLKGFSKTLMYLLIVILLIFIIGYFARVGIFVMEPNSIMEEGITLIYHSRKPYVDFLSSSESICVKFIGNLNNVINKTACGFYKISALGDLSDRIILSLPYSDLLYKKAVEGIFLQP